MTQHNFSNMSVADWLVDHPVEPVVIPTDTTMDTVAQLLLANNSRDAYMLDNNKIVGHLGFANMANHLLAEHRPTHTHRQLFSRITEPTVGDVMDSHFAYARSDESLCEVIHRQLERDVDTLVVLADDGSLLGAIKLSELVAESLK